MKSNLFLRQCLSILVGFLLAFSPYEKAIAGKAIQISIDTATSLKNPEESEQSDLFVRALDTTSSELYKAVDQFQQQKKKLGIGGLSRNFLAAATKTLSAPIKMVALGIPTYFLLYFGFGMIADLDAASKGHTQFYRTSNQLSQTSKTLDRDLVYPSLTPQERADLFSQEHRLRTKTNWVGETKDWPGHVAGWSFTLGIIVAVFGSYLLNETGMDGEAMSDFVLKYLSFLTKIDDFRLAKLRNTIRTKFFDSYALLQLIKFRPLWRTVQNYGEHSSGQVILIPDHPIFKDIDLNNLYDYWPNSIPILELTMKMDNEYHTMEAELHFTYSYPSKNVMDRREDILHLASGEADYVHLPIMPKFIMGETFPEFKYKKEVNYLHHSMLHELGSTLKDKIGNIMDEFRQKALTNKDNLNK